MKLFGIAGFRLRRRFLLWCN